MYLYLTCSITYGVNLYLDLRNVNKFKFKRLHSREVTLKCELAIIEVMSQL
jgi:hypothetical protein